MHKITCFVYQLFIGESEGPVEQVRSILAQFEFAHLKQYEAQGIPFYTCMYVPEEHTETKSIFYVKWLI